MLYSEHLCHRDVIQFFRHSVPHVLCSSVRKCFDVARSFCMWLIRLLSTMLFQSFPFNSRMSLQFCIAIILVLCWLKLAHPYLLGLWMIDLFVVLLILIALRSVAMGPA